jgi:hypothetical protein
MMDRGKRGEKRGSLPRGEGVGCDESVTDAGCRHGQAAARCISVEAGAVVGASTRCAAAL